MYSSPILQWNQRQVPYTITSPALWMPLLLPNLSLFYHMWCAQCCLVVSTFRVCRWSHPHPPIIDMPLCQTLSASTLSPCRLLLLAWLPGASFPEPRLASRILLPETMVKQPWIEFWILPLEARVNPWEVVSLMVEKFIWISFVERGERFQYWSGIVAGANQLGITRNYDPVLITSP